ncbi:hypothetical protein T484DRAFT_1911028, partial [Baffinella frigidus]
MMAPPSLSTLAPHPPSTHLEAPGYLVDAPRYLAGGSMAPLLDSALSSASAPARASSPSSRLALYAPQNAPESQRLLNVQSRGTDAPPDAARSAPLQNGSKGLGISHSSPSPGDRGRERSAAPQNGSNGSSSSIALSREASEAVRKEACERVALEVFAVKVALEAYREKVVAHLQQTAAPVRLTHLGHYFPRPAVLKEKMAMLGIFVGDARFVVDLIGGKSGQEILSLAAWRNAGVQASPDDGGGAGADQASADVGAA